LITEDGLSSNSILEAGELSSSNCPDFTLHRNASRKREATLTLAIRRIMITLIVGLFSRKNIPTWFFKR
jgi:hypothetical protein